MFDMSTDTYTCDFCEFEMQWDGHDEVHGEVWGCEKCGQVFCSKCFIDRYGFAAYMEMMQDFDLILCPDCYEKEKENKYDKEIY